MKYFSFSMFSGCWLFATLSLFVQSPLAATELPGWLKKAVRQPTPIVTPDTPAVVLFNESILTVDSQGKATWQRRYAVKILNRAGLSEASGSVFYLDKKEKVVSAEAWLLRAGKVAKSESQNKWFDWTDAAAEGAIFTETRAKQIHFKEDAVPEDIFACETEVNGPMLFAQENYAWDTLLPVVIERHTVSVPTGWSVEAVMVGPEKPAVSVSPDNRTWTWELKDRPYRPHEPWRSTRDIVEAQVMVNLVAGPAAKAGMPRIFRSWTEEAEWEEKNAAGQCDADPEMATKVRRLTAECTGDVAKIRALAGYVQKLRYVAVNRDLARGMGYRPRKASEVFTKGFGDCKDKSNLLRAMLREAGIQSFPVAALSSFEKRAVYGEWPTPFQFNHAILAIKVGDETGLSPVVKTRWGNLLFFDPTDPETFVGDLPWYLQGTNVHVIASDSSELIRLPDLPIERRWLTERRIRLVLTAKGAVSGDCLFTAFAQSGAQLRRSVHEMTAKELHDWATGRISETIRGATAKDVASADDPVTGQFSVSFNFGETSFAQMMPGGLSIVRMDVLNRDTIPTFSEKERKTPVELQPRIQNDEVELTLPNGIGIEELPTKTVLSSAFGSYENSFEKAAGKIVFRRTLKLNPIIVSLEDYPKLRQFLSNAAKADRGAVVLRSQPSGTASK